MKAEDYHYSSIGNCYVHHETGNLFEDDLKEYVESQLKEEREEKKFGDYLIDALPSSLVNEYRKDYIKTSNPK